MENGKWKMENGSLEYEAPSPLRGEGIFRYEERVSEKLGEGV